MKQAGSSFQAKTVITFLALESQRPEADRLFSDPLACRLADDQALAVGRLIDRMMPDLRPLFMVRARYLDEQITAAVQRGVSQVLFVGSRYETRPHRLLALHDGVRVFEVDHPGDTRWKQETLPALFGARRRPVVYVPWDMTREDLRQCLGRHGYDPGQPSLFVSEGVSFMFTAAEADRFVRLVAAAGAPGSLLLFSYVHPFLVSGMDYFLEAKRAVLGPQAKAEPMTFGIDPAQVAAYLAERGYGHVVNVSAGELKQRYLGDDQLAIQDYVALATIGKEATG